MVTKASARRSSRAPSGTGPRRLGLGQRRLRKGVGDAVLVDGDERDRARRRGVAEARDHPRLRQAVAARIADLLGLDQLALARPGAVAVRHQPVAVGALVDGGDAAAALALVVDADDPPRAHADAADHPGGERRLGSVHRRHPPEKPVAGAQRRVVAAGEDQDARRRAFALPFRRLRPEIALGIRAGGAQDEDGRKRALGPDPAALPFELARLGHLGEQPLELDLGRPLEPEGAGDVAPGRQRGVVAQEGEDVVGRGEAVHRPPLARGRCRRQSAGTSTRDTPGRLTSPSEPRIAEA